MVQPAVTMFASCVKRLTEQFKYQTVHYLGATERVYCLMLPGPSCQLYYEKCQAIHLKL